MKSRTLTALAVAGAFACGGAFAGGMHHAAQHSSTQGRGFEVSTPSSVDESAPWLANQAHSAGWASPDSTHTVIGMQEGLHSDPIGASSALGGSGSGGYDSMSSLGYDSSIYGLDYSLNDTGGVDYWLLGDESTFGTGASSSVTGSGYGGLDSMSLNSDESFDMSSLSGDELATTEYYVVSGPLALFDPSTEELYHAGPDDLAFLTSPPEGVWVITPIYEEMADASSFSIEPDQQLSQYSPLSGDEDLAT
jgi:hypothetical protein